jgi:hypothetical protein
LKVQKYEAEDWLVKGAENDVKSLEALGAPKSYGIFRVPGENGRWRPALALELVSGNDLLTLDFARIAQASDRRPWKLPTLT